ncbi:hypothetical protein PHMEG_00021728, partial [Phytophthora megakarya]
MRWYCVHPSLPPQAELRIRAAPDSNAEERARISQGRAIAACSPIFHVAGEFDTLAWLQVAYQDVDSGNTEGGFVMATLPDGTELVTPWELTDVCSCGEVDTAALVFDGPQENAKSLGTVTNVNFLYCITEEKEERVRITHPEMESVWVEKKSVQMVCTRFKHEACRTPHTFYELNDALPEEAQIAIREFPSKEAQTVALLSRGETLEVVVRGGNWLQIAGGNVDKAWIMWRTDAIELLQEAPDVWSSTCKQIESSVADDVENLTRQQEDARLEEVARQQVVELARQEETLENTRQQEVAKAAETAAAEAEATAADEVARQEEKDRLKEISRKEDIARQEEAVDAEAAAAEEEARLKEIARQKEAAAAQELALQEEYARLDEIARQEDLARQEEAAAAEAAAAEEEARLKEIARQKEAAAAQELALQEEYARLDEIARQEDLARQEEAAAEAAAAEEEARLKEIA